jgi:ribose transport system ATP-binding protein
MHSRMSGISTAFQELSLLPNLTVAENFFMPRLTRAKQKLISKKQNEDIAAQILADFDLTFIDPASEVGSLALAERQKLEIARAVSHNPRLLLLDEPTAALPDPEWLYRILERFHNNELTVLYISHRLNEIRDLCCQATVLRNGSSITTVEMADTSESEILQMMIGGTRRSVAANAARKKLKTPPVIETDKLCGNRIRDISFAINKGEILGVTGLEGQGQDELFKILAGVQPPKSGAILIDGRSVTLKSPSAALKHGISFVPEERKVDGILPGMKTLANITVSSLKKASTLGFFFGGKEKKEAVPAAQTVELNPDYLDMDIDSLSGGNQQKAVLARSIMTGAQILLLYDPSRGVDVGTKKSFQEVMERFTDGGGSVLWYSTDLFETAAVADRILVFYKGTIAADLENDGLDMESVLAAAIGQTENAEGPEK